jgi:hypothetical protein
MLPVQEITAAINFSIPKGPAKSTDIPIQAWPYQLSSKQRLCYWYFFQKDTDNYRKGFSNDI